MGAARQMPSPLRFLILQSEIEFGTPVKIAAFLAGFWPVRTPLRRRRTFDSIDARRIRLDIQHRTSIACIDVIRADRCGRFIHICDFHAGCRDWIRASRHCPNDGVILNPRSKLSFILTPDQIKVLAAFPEDGKPSWR